MLADILPVILSSFISSGRIRPAHSLCASLPRSSSVLHSDLRVEEDGCGVGINSTLRGWTDRTQLPEAAQHCHTVLRSLLRAAASSHSLWSCAKGTGAAERGGGRAKPAASTGKLRMHTEIQALPGPQSLASFSPQQPADSSLCSGNKLFLYQMWV